MEVLTFVWLLSTARYVGVDIWIQTTFETEDVVELVAVPMKIRPNILRFYLSEKHPLWKDRWIFMWICVDIVCCVKVFLVKMILQFSIYFEHSFGKFNKLLGFVLLHIPVLSLLVYFLRIFLNKICWEFLFEVPFAVFLFLR